MWATLKGLARDGHLLGLRTRMLREVGGYGDGMVGCFGEGLPLGLNT